MPRRVIDQAVIEYVPDLTAFARESQRVLGAAFRQVEQTAKTSATGVERVWNGVSNQLNQTFDNVATEARQSFETVERQAGETANEMTRDFQREGERVEDTFSEISSRAKREMAEVSATTAAATTGASRRFSKMGLAGGAALLGVGAAAVAGLGMLATMGLQSAAQLEQMQIGFNALTGSAEAGLKVFKELQDFAAKTPFEFPDVANAAKRFLAFNDALGMSDAQLLQFLTTVGDVASVVGTGAEGLNRVVLALGQISSKGKLSLEELMQIGEALPGFSGVAAIAAARGTSTAQAMEDISAGAVGAQEGVAALLAGMEKFPGAAGAMQMQSETLLGVFSTFKDVVGQTLASAFAPAVPLIKQSLKDITPVIGEALGQVAPAIGQLLAGVLPLLATIIKVLAPVLGPILRALGDALKSLGPSLEDLGPPLVEIAVSLVPILPLLAELIKLLAMILVPVLKLIAPLFQLLAPVIEFVAKAVGQFVTWLERVNWGSVGRAIGGAFTSAWNATKNFFVGIGRFIADAPARIMRGITRLPETFARGVSLAFTFALRAVGMGIGLIIAAITRLPALAFGALIQLSVVVNTFFRNMWNSVVANTQQGIAIVVGFVMSLPRRFGAALSALPGIVAALFNRTMSRARDIVRTVINTIVNFFSSMPKRLSGLASNIGQSIVNFIKGFLNNAIGKVNEGIAKIDSIVPGSLPRIPFLAQGGIAFGPALIGEDASTGPEAAIPLGDSRAVRMLQDALGTGAPVTFAPGSVVVNIQGTVTPAQAGKIGRAVGENIAGVLTQRGIRTAVRVS